MSGTLVFGWVTISNQPGQLSLSIPTWVTAMSKLAGTLALALYTWSHRISCFWFSIAETDLSTADEPRGSVKTYCFTLCYGQKQPGSISTESNMRLWLCTEQLQWTNISYISYKLSRLSS